MGPSSCIIHVIGYIGYIGSIALFGTGICRFCIWVELPVQWRLCPILVRNVGSPDIHECFRGLTGSQQTPEFGVSHRNLFSIKLQRSLYGLKQSGRMWYQRLSEYLIKERYKNDPICPCVFIKKSETGFSFVAVYVNDINLIGTPEELAKTVEYFKKEFEVKDLGKTKLCLGLQLEHKANGIIVHQSSYIKRLLKRFNMDKAHQLSTPMIVRSIDP